MSTLASLSFVIYINDLSNISEMCQPLLCVNDAKITLQFLIDLSHYEKWSDRNNIPPNKTKRPDFDFGSSNKTFLLTGNGIVKYIVPEDLVLLIPHDSKLSDHRKQLAAKHSMFSSFSKDVLFSLYCQLS